jgi:hypothetical protein
VHELALAFAAEVLGACRLVGDRSWPARTSTVLEVATDDGARWFVKVHHDAGRHAAEVRALLDWAPALDDRAPRLVAHDAERLAVVLSALPGVSPDGLTPAVEQRVHQQAGALLRRFHDAEPPRLDVDGATPRVAAYRHWTSRAPDGLLDAADLAFAEPFIDVAMGLPAVAVVPTHGDWSPRNWLLDDDRLAIIDFERSERSWWTKDLERLEAGAWIGRPDLRDAFLDGYGRALQDHERQALRAAMVLGQVTSVVWADEHGDEAFAAKSRENLRRLRADSLG